MFRFILLILNPFFWVEFYDLVVNDCEDDSLDLTDTPRSAEEAEIQQQEYEAWKQRQRKKGRLVE